MIIIKMNWISILQNYDLLNGRVQISVKIFLTLTKKVIELNFLRSLSKGEGIRIALLNHMQDVTLNLFQGQFSLIDFIK